MTRFIHFFFILYILTAGSAWSINFQNLTLDDAHKIASENNYELLYLLEEKNSRSSALQEYQAQYFPQINAGVIFPFYGRSSAINVDQLLFDFGKLSQRINAGKYLIRAQEYSHEGKKISILNEVTEKFYEVLKTKNHISGLESERETKNKQLKKSIAFLEAGRVSSLDVAEKNLNLSRIELELISKKGLLRKLEEEFFTLLGVQRPSEVNYVANLKYTKIDLNSEAIIDSYMMNMYEIKALEMSILSTKATISAIYRDFLPNIVARAAYRFEGKTTYALEGSIFVAGSAIQWLRDGLNFFENASESEDFALQANDNSKVLVVPALTGLGAPYWDADARGAIFGLTRDTGIPEITKAVLESVVYQTKDLLEAMKNDNASFNSLKIDGGMVANNWFSQELSNVLQVTVSRPKVIETTSLGAAYLAGLHAGVFDTLSSLKENWSIDKEFKPRNSRNGYLEWKEAVNKVLTD